MSLLQKVSILSSKEIQAVSLSEQALKIFKKTTPVFDAVLEAYESGNYRVISNQGSTRSSKTYSICQLIVLVAMTETKSITVTAESLPHLKKGAMKDILSILQDFGHYSKDNHNMTDQVYIFPETGSYIEFFGVEDDKKVRGPDRDILYVNEANLIKQDTYKQLALRTKGQIFIDFNPADDYSWVYDVSDHPGNKLIQSNFLNNLSNLTKGQIEEIYQLKEQDENAWKVFGLGLRGHSSETIYTHWKLCDKLPGRGEIFFGQDFGYNVQSALVCCEIFEGTVYVELLIYETKLTTSDLIEKYKILGIGRTKEIFCDAAEPKTIEELRRAGFNAKPADKDVTEGIRKCKGMPIRITADSTDMIKEIRNYKWKIDKEGKVLDEPIKFNDHAMDALRYAIFTKLTGVTINWKPR